MAGKVFNAYGDLASTIMNFNKPIPFPPKA